QIGRIEEHQLGGRIGSGAHGFVAEDRVSGDKRRRGAGEVARDVVMRQSGRADMFLRFSPDDACRQRADRNQDVLQEAQLPTSIPGPNSPPPPSPLTAIIGPNPKMSSQFTPSSGARHPPHLPVWVALGGGK